MAIYKRGKVYHFNFWWRGEHVQRSTKQGNPRVARQLEAALKTALAKGEVGMVERQPAIRLKDFAPQFTDEIQVRCKPQTVAFYAAKLARLLEYKSLADSHLDKIDTALIARYVVSRSQTVGPATVNREMATLRRLLRLAKYWDVIASVPRIKMLPGEVARDFVLDYKQEKMYLDAAPQPLSDIALLILETGLRLGEALRLEWRDVHMFPVNGPRHGYLHVRDGKSRHARRNVPLTRRATKMLKARSNKSELVFASGSDKPYVVSSIDHLHAKCRTKLGMPDAFVVHSLRHTMLTRLGESGAEAFYIMKIAGHSSVTVSQRYIHPTPEGLERTMERFQTMNRMALKRGPKRQPATTVPTTVALHDAVSC